ncbi:MAG TPA: FAD-binding and (Fe-S)-binding domain-containing protein [Candidatus Sulfotelmatobacter sp.]|nr:FAD-binding and (Fe-S)-binding domain-containing protein [Candidatus Sulfotelmatobacter sp.]
MAGIAQEISTASTAPNELKELLGKFIEPGRVLTRPIDRIAFASDASFYRLIPRAVVLAKGTKEIQSLFRFSHQSRIPLTFRTAGTSLSGQAVTDGILVEVARYWKAVSVEAGGKKVRVQPGVIGAHVNRALLPHRAKIGPDPASINACMIGGILSNNSSGMCCGVALNAYHTLDSLTFVLPSGTAIDSADPNANELFREREPRLAEGLFALRREILAHPALLERIRAKYRTKNTTGYSLNAFIDFERPVDIFAHLLIGSEGTLAFLAEAVLNTVPDLPVKYTGLLLFPDLYAACEAIVPLREADAKAVELMDRASLRSVEDQPGIPASIRKLSPAAAGLLVEFQSESESDRQTLESRARAIVGKLKLVEPPLFTHEPAEQALLWKIRAGMYPAVGAVRMSGTTVIIEDVAFPVEHLADAALDLTKLFAKHRYDNAIIFGHAKDGNLHFVMTQSFNDQAAVDQYAGFMEELVKLVVDRYHGALKAEHGTGRNIAPFVETEWGWEAYSIMKRLKQLADPENLLNPGVIINSDPKAYLHHLKPMPAVEPEVDKCIECGYCESKCPSRDLTTTPRRRIVIRREMARLQNETGAGRELLAALEADFPYDVLDTCAVDGLCATACPVAIDTGQLTKRLRGMRHSARAQSFASYLAENFGRVESGVRMALRAGHAIESVFGAGAMIGITRLMRFFAGQAIPLWARDVPSAAHRLPQTQRQNAEAIYFPSCISRVMGRLPGEPDDFTAVQLLVSLGARAGVPVHIPESVAGLCCGVPFSSKGFEPAHALACNRAIERFWEWSGEGGLPIVIDTSPCTYGLLTSRLHLTPMNQGKFDRLRILDSIAFVHGTLLPKLKIRRKSASATLHTVCSVEKMSLGSKLEAVARACSGRVKIPANTGCCGFAGDRGFLLPELTASATRLEAAEAAAENSEGYFSSSRTCEIGMSRATGRIYRSFLHLVEQATRE